MQQTTVDIHVVRFDTSERTYHHRWHTRRYAARATGIAREALSRTTNAPVVIEVMPAG